MSENNSPWRNNGRKPQSHCGKGHALTADNIIYRQNGKGRDCKQCARLRYLAYQERQKAKQHESLR